VATDGKRVLMKVWWLTETCVRRAIFLIELL
jgi:hypothetical protein